MKRKVGGIVIALVLALVGTIALIAFVDQAKEDAIEGEALVDVLVVTNAIRQGAPLGEIDDRVELTAVPQRLVAPDALTTLAELDPVLVAGIDLAVGEQLLQSRLVNPESLVRVEVPAGLQELTVEFDPQRAVGAAVAPGELVGIVLSFASADIIAVPASTLVPDPTATTQPAVRTPDTTKLTLNQVLVTAVQLSSGDAERAEEDDADDEAADDPTVEAAPDGALLVTLAVTTAQAEQIVFAAEFGNIWLTRQNEETDLTGSRILTLDQVYVTVPE